MAETLASLVRQRPAHLVRPAVMWVGNGLVLVRLGWAESILLGPEGTTMKSALRVCGVGASGRDLGDGWLGLLPGMIWSIYRFGCAGCVPRRLGVWCGLWGCGLVVG
jgi:hypothetical protein